MKLAIKRLLENEIQKKNVAIKTPEKRKRLCHYYKEAEQARLKNKQTENSYREINQLTQKNSISIVRQYKTRLGLINKRNMSVQLRKIPREIIEDMPEPLEWQKPNPKFRKDSTLIKDYKPTIWRRETFPLTSQKAFGKQRRAQNELRKRRKKLQNMYVDIMTSKVKPNSWRNNQ